MRERHGLRDDWLLALIWLEPSMGCQLSVLTASILVFASADARSRRAWRSLHLRLPEWTVVDSHMAGRSSPHRSERPDRLLAIEEEF